MSAPQIRPATDQDHGSWFRLRRSLWPRCPDKKHELEITQLLRSEGIAFLAETDDGEIIGLAEVSLRRDHVDGASICPVPYLEGWFVDAAFRGQGVGRALIAAVEGWAIERGYSELASDAEIENALSIRLHRQLGFTEIDRNVTFLKTLKK